MGKQQNYSLRIHNFTYNGFFGQLKVGYMKAKGMFLGWTGDPGVALILLDNGKKLRVPTFALSEKDNKKLPEDKMPKVLFGESSSSET